MSRIVLAADIPEIRKKQFGAPLIQGVEVFNPRSPKKGWANGFVALIDTASNHTILPGILKKRLGFKDYHDSVAGYRLKNQNDASSTDLHVYYAAHLRICGVTIPTEHVIFGEGDYVQLGRDVLQYSSLWMCWVEKKEGHLTMTPPSSIRSQSTN